MKKVLLTLLGGCLLLASVPAGAVSGSRELTAMKVAAKQTKINKDEYIRPALSEPGKSGKPTLRKVRNIRTAPSATITSLGAQPKKVISAASEDYSNFVFLCGGYGKVYYEPVATDRTNVFQFENVPMFDGCVFYLRDINSTNAYVTLSSGNYVSSSDPETTLEAADLATAESAWLMTAQGFEGTYTVTVEYTPESAKVSFERTGDVIFNPASVFMWPYQESGAYRPTAMLEDYTYVYGGVTIEDEGYHYYIFEDYRTGRMYAVPEDGDGIYPGNMNTEVVLDGENFLVLYDMEGTYDMTLSYNEDYSAATVTFVDPNNPPEKDFSDYTGDIFITNSALEWMFPYPEYQFTCTAPGIFEWSGDRLDNGFIFIAWENDEGTILGCPENETETYVELGVPFKIEVNSNYTLVFRSKEYVLKPHIELDLHNMTFTLTSESDSEFNPAEVYLYDRDTELQVKPEVLENGIVYRQVNIPEGIQHYALIYEGSYYGWDESNDSYVTDENPETTFKTNPTYYITTDLQGTYDIYVTFNETHTGGTMKFEKIDVNWAEYTGDLFISGNFNGWATGDEDYRMTCTAPGVYEWSGDRLDDGFIFMGNNIYFGHTESGAANVQLDTPMEISPMSTTYFNLDNMAYVKDAHITLNLAEMTFTLTGTGVTPTFDPQETYLWQYSIQGIYEPELTKEGVVYHDVLIDGLDGFLLVTPYKDMGWPNYENNEMPVVTEGNPTTTAVDDPDMLIHAVLEGYFDVYAVFNENGSQAELTFQKTQEIYPYLTVTMENGTSFKTKGNQNMYSNFTVSTNDDYWVITGYTYMGETFTLSNPSSVFHATFTYSSEDTEVLFHQEYTGLCEVIDSPTGTVEFENNLKFTRRPEGVRVENVVPGSEVAVYTVSGQVISLSKAQSTDLTINLNKGQTYIVRVGTVAVKFTM